MVCRYGKDAGRESHINMGRYAGRESFADMVNMSVLNPLPGVNGLPRVNHYR